MRGKNHLAACRRMPAESSGCLLAGSVCSVAAIALLLLLLVCAAAAPPNSTAPPGLVHVRASRSTSKTTPAPQATLKHTSTRSPGLITKTTDAIYRALSGVFTYGSDEMEDEGVMAETVDDYLLESTTPPVQLVRLTSTSTTSTTTQPPTTKAPKSTTTTTTLATPVPAVTSTQNSSLLPATTTAKAMSTLPSVTTPAKLDQTSASTSGPILGSSSSSTTNEPKSIVSTTTTTKPPGPSATTTSTATMLPATTTTASPTTTTTARTSTTTTTDTTSTSTPEPPTSSSTRKPKRRKKKEKAATTAEPSAVVEPIELQATNASSAAEQHSKLYEMIADAITAVLPSLGLLNRTTRVAPERELGDFSLESGRLTLDGETFQPATSEDVHLLCKLLHRHLETSNKTAATSTTPMSTTTTTTTTTRKPTTTSPTTKPPGSSTNKPAENEVGLFVREPGELDGSLQASHLLESWFNFERQNTATRAESLAQAETAATEFLLNLYELAAKSPPDRTAAEPASDYENDEEVTPAPGIGHSDPGKGNQTREFKLHTWNKTKLNSKGHLRFVYWLLERANATHFRVVEPAEAQQLLERLARAQVDRQVEATAGGRLRPQHVSLVGPYQEGEHSQRGRHKHKHNNHHHHDKNSDHKPGDDHGHHHHEADTEPHVIDDTLVTLGEQPSSTSTTVAPPRGSAPKSSFQVLMDRLGEASFMDNFQLYLAVFILALLLIILCFACPMICFKLSRNSKSRELPGAPSTAPGGGRAVRARTTSQSGPTGRRRGVQRAPPPSKEPPVPPQPLKGILSGPKGEVSGAGAEPISILSGRQQQQQHQRPSAGGEESPDSMWRRLSSTTTTLVRDESHSFRTDGATPASPDLRGSEHGQTGKESAKRSQFEWYSFEDKLERQEMLKAHGRRPPPASGEQGPGDSRSPREVSVVEQQRQRLSKSVQAPSEDSARELALPLWLEFRERHEARTSDTLTKSELMLVKEKLVPIARQHQQRQVASQTSEPWDPVYVNQSAAAGELERQATQQAATGPSGNLEQLVSRFIDSSESRSDSNERQGAMAASLESQQQENAQEQRRSQLHSEPQQVDLSAAERRPKMRLLELPPRTQSRVEAIKAELSKLEQRDQAATQANISRRPSRRSDSSPQRLEDGGTYRRYDL